LDAVPQFFAPQALAFERGVQPHTLETPPPLQVCGEVQPPQLCVPPQPFDTVPHLPAQAAAIVTGTHWQVLEAPPHASLAAHAVQRAVSLQPLFASVGTQLLPHFLASAPQVPMTHAPPSQMSVFAPGAGQVEASQVESPQP
jgi:hypothetical protein